MNPSLKRVLILRYKPALILLVSLILGIYFFQTVAGVTSWKNDYKYFHSKAATVDFDKQIQDSYSFDDGQGGKIFLYYDLAKEHAVYTDSFDDYKDYTLTVFNSKTDSNQQAFNAYSYYNEHFLIMLIIVVSSGVLLFLFDLKSNFTAALFSSRFKRSEIYWHKLSIVGLTIGASLLIGKLGSLLAYQFFIPNEFLNITLYQHLISTLSGWLTLISVFVLSSFIGLLFGEWLYGIATIIVLFFTFSTFLSNVDMVYSNFFVNESDITYTVSANALTRYLPVAQTTTLGINVLSLVTIIVLAILALVLGNSIFKKISLEQTGDFLMVPQFNRLFQVIMIIYGMTITTTTTILTTLLPDTPLTKSELFFNVSYILLMFIVFFLASEFLLFNKKSIIINKINVFN